MNQDKFIRVSVWTDHDLWLFCKNVTAKYGHLAALHVLLDFRKEIQKGLAGYAKGKSFLDGIQMGAVRITEKIAKWCGHYYKTWAMKEILKKKPDLIHKTQKLKGLTNNAWEIFLRDNSY